MAAFDFLRGHSLLSHAAMPIPTQPAPDFSGTAVVDKEFKQVRRRGGAYDEARSVCAEVAAS